MKSLIIELRGDDGFTQLAYEIPIRDADEAKAQMELNAELVEVLRGDPQRSEAYQ